MDAPSPDLDTKPYGCHGVGCLIVVVIVAPVLILNATGTCVAE